MKTLNDYMAMNYRMEIIEDREEGGYVVSYPELPGCLTCGETIESAVANAIDAKKARRKSKVWKNVLPDVSHARQFVTKTEMLLLKQTI